MSLDLAAPLRTALIEQAPITALLGLWAGEPSIHTRRPLPADAGYPQLLINPPAAIGDADGLVSRRPIVIRDIAAYGQQPDQVREVEALGYLIRELFHRQKFSLSVPGYDVIDVRASGPMPAPVDDADTVGRMVSLTIRLRRQE